MCDRQDDDGPDSGFRNVLGDLIDTLHDEMNYEVNHSPATFDMVQKACEHLGPAYAGYLGEWF